MDSTLATSIKIPLMLILFGGFSSHYEVTASAVVIKRIVPDPSLQEYPCPEQMIELECNIVKPAVALVWRLPSGDELPDYNGGSSVGAVRISDDGNYRAILTGKRDDDDPNNGLFFFNSTIIIMNSTNGSIISCLGTDVSSVSGENYTIQHSGVPGTPMALKYENASVMNSHYVLVWEKPSFTGSAGVFVENYTIETNGRTLEVSDRHTVVKWNISKEFYGDINVTAVNSCNQQSDLVSIDIPYQGPSQPNLQMEMNCNMPLRNGRKVKLFWVRGEKDPGYVYPEVSDIKLNINTDHNIGSNDCKTLVPDDMNCAFQIFENKNYTLTINFSSDAGSTMNIKTFDSTPVSITENDASNTSCIAVVHINEYCVRSNHTIIVYVGEKQNGGECNILHSFEVVTLRNLTCVRRPYFLSKYQHYCYIAVLKIDAGHTMDESGNKMATHEIVLVLSCLCGIFLLAILLVAIISVILCFRKRKYSESTNTLITRSNPNPYEDVGLERRSPNITVQDGSESRSTLSNETPPRLENNSTQDTVNTIHENTSQDIVTEQSGSPAQVLPGSSTIVYATLDHTGKEKNLAPCAIPLCLSPGAPVTYAVVKTLAEPP